MPAWGQGVDSKASRDLSTVLWAVLGGTAAAGRAGVLGEDWQGLGEVLHCDISLQGLGFLQVAARAGHVGIKGENWPALWAGRTGISLKTSVLLTPDKEYVLFSCCFDLYFN